MNFNQANQHSIYLCLFFTLLFTNLSIAQDSTITKKSDFWSKVRFGGGLGLSTSNNFFTLGVSPSAVYQFNEYVSAGTALNYTYNKFDNQYKSHIYGGSILGLFNPLREIQLSTELEMLRVNRNFEGVLNGLESDNYWSPALFVGAGYRTDFVTIGLRYDLLYNDNKSVYSSAVIPFVRVFF